MPRVIQKRIQHSQMRRPKPVVQALLALGLLLPVCLRAQTPLSRRPINPDLLQGGELIVESHNFAITAPPGDWQWSVAEDQGDAHHLASYVCTETASGAELALTIIDAQVSSDSKFTAGFKNGLRESLTASGLTVVSIDMAPLSMPLPGSYRSQWQAVRSDGMTVHGYGYVTGGKPAYILQHATTEASEPPVFTAFVRSFRLLHAWQSRSENQAVLVLMGYLLVLGLACGIASIVNRAHDKMILNGGTLGAILVLVVMTIWIVVENWAAFLAGLPGAKADRPPEYRVGQALIPLLIAVLVSRSFRKRKMREEKMLAETRPLKPQ